MQADRLIIMRKTIGQTLALIILSSPLAGQVLDGVYIKEHTRSRLVSYNNNVADYYHNSIFRTQQKEGDTAFIKLDSTICRQYNQFEKAPLKIKDCIFFNPIEKFICNYSPSQENETYFYLNTVDYQPSERSKETLIFPYSLRHYIDVTEISVTPGQIEMNLDSAFQVPFGKYLTPFYFRKYEVTNAEYREFVNWVRDSIARLILFEEGLEQFGERSKPNTVRLNWKTPILWQDSVYQEVLGELYLPENRRFYRRKEIDARRLNYRYYQKIGDSIVNKIVNVYPDTLCWIHDFNYSINEPMTNMYFWHPYYDDYPVVGVSYYQALAFLKWKTDKHQNELNQKGVKVRVEYDLPTEAEWEIAATAEIIDKKVAIYTNNYYYLADDSWLTDLSLKSSNIIRTDSIDEKTNKHYITNRNDLLFEFLKRNYTYKDNLRVDLEIDGAFHTHKVNINEIDNKNSFVQSNQDALGICFMGGNVSEWLKESYQENWKPIFDTRQALLSTFKDTDIEILSQIETYYDKKNDPTGRLVIGANWYDERFSDKSGKNIEGINTKLFVNPDSSYSTLGFRYVIHVQPR